MSERLDNEAELVVKEYKDGLDYQQQMGFTEEWPENERFKTNDHWPPATDRTQNLPRPVIPMIEFLITHKTASVMNESVKMQFSPQETPPQVNDPSMLDQQMMLAVEGSQKFTDYSDTTWENIEQDKLCEDVVDDAATTGTGIVHYYWDNDQKGGISTQYIGDMRGEVIDPINIFFGNPQCKDVQKQPYIIISSRESVKEVKELAKENGVPLEKLELIKPDKEVNSEGYEAAKKELNDAEKVTVLTRYCVEYNRVGTGLFDPTGKEITTRQKRIYFKKIACSVVIQPKTDTMFTRYPIAAFQWGKRKKCIFGISEVRGLIPNQKYINLLFALLLLSVQDTAWPKVLAKPGALGNQKIYNIPGEVLTDYHEGDGDGIKFMTPGQINTFAAAMVDKILEVTRNYKGANEAATGEPFTKQLNAAAIIAMQNAAKVPIDQIKKRYYRFIEDIGRIWEEFWKVKYSMKRNITVKDQDGNEMPTKFQGTLYANVPMRLKIDVGPGSSYSESLAMTTLEKAYDKGDIDVITYLKHAPKNVVPNKERLIKDIEAKQQQNVVADLLQRLPPDIQQIVIQALQAQQQPQQGVSQIPA